MISKDKTRVQISITHEALERLQLMAISMECTKSDILEDMINDRYEITLAKLVKEVNING